MTVTAGRAAVAGGRDLCCGVIGMAELGLLSDFL